MSKKKTTEEFIIDAKSVHGDRYSYDKSKYINANTKLIVTCKLHGDFLIKPSSHTNSKYNCAKCSIISMADKKKSDTSTFIIKSNAIHNNFYDYSKTEYSLNTKKVIIICPNHGEFLQVPNYHLSGNGCKKCSINKNSKIKLSNTEQFIEKAKLIHNDLYDYNLVDYIKSNIPVDIKCLKHNKIFSQKPNKHLSNQGCPLCKSSHGEKLVSNYLNKNKIKFKNQHTFDTCLSDLGNKLLFDFYLIDFNCLIEFDGEQHFKEWRTKKPSKSRLENIVKRDNIKNKWCLDNEYNLLRIPYTKINHIDIIISEFLTKTK